MQNVQSMKPVQYIQVSYFAHFSKLFFFNFEINGYFHIFFLFLLGGGGVGGGGCFGAGDIERFY